MEYVSFDDAVETVIEGSEPVKILESLIEEGNLHLVCGTITEECIKIKFTSEETIEIVKTVMKEMARRAPKDSLI